MNTSEVKRLRAASALKEVICEAFGEFEDEMLRGLCVTDVECKKGRFDAFVLLDKGPFDAREQEYVLSRLKRVSGVIERHIMASEGWVKSPHLHFKFDDRLEYQNHIDAVFAKVAKELETGHK